MRSLLAGLSPRARGNPLSAVVYQLLPRSIPACTGEPAGNRRHDYLPTVYPRVHGGTAALAVYQPYSRGLSPRARGNHAEHSEGEQNPGSIPACTGEPTDGLSTHRLAGVYPRVHGGTPLRVDLNEAEQGLSPRARGNPSWPPSRRVLRRSIPACTGEPPVRGFDLRLPEVYPRVHGGTPNTVPLNDAPTGLSPRARGNPQHRPT